MTRKQIMADPVGWAKEAKQKDVERNLLYGFRGATKKGKETTAQFGAALEKRQRDEPFWRIVWTIFAYHPEVMRCVSPDQRLKGLAVQQRRFSEFLTQHHEAAARLAEKAHMPKNTSKRKGRAASA